VPEGHTLHRLALDLTSAFGGRIVSVTSPQGRFADSAVVLDQTRMVEATAHGKHLFCEFDGDRFLHVHLGLIGKFMIGPEEPPWGEVRVRIAADGRVADLRGPQLCAVVTRAEIDATIAQLGPDPLRPDADPELAWRRIRRATRPIAALLMDQTILSGVGNVYRAEVLFRHGLDPQLPGRSLRREQWDAMWADLVELLTEGYRRGLIETLRPEHDPLSDGATGVSARRVYVYRRAGEPCLVCGTPVAHAEHAARNLFWCPTCQSVRRRERVSKRAARPARRAR
jgi:endonuclease VIII